MRPILSVLSVLLLALPAWAQQSPLPVPPKAHILWSHTGFSYATADFYACRPTEAVRGTVAVTLAGGGALTGTGAFSGIVAPESVGGVGAFWKATGIKARQAGKDYIWNVTAKTSNDAVTVQRGAGAPAETGTPSEWFYWNTECLHVAASTDITDAQLKRLTWPWSFARTGPYYSDTKNWDYPINSYRMSAANEGGGAGSMRVVVQRWGLGGAAQQLATDTWATSFGLANYATSSLVSRVIYANVTPTLIGAMLGTCVSSPCGITVVEQGISTQKYPVPILIVQ